MKINSSNLYSLYNTQKTAPKSVQRAARTEQTAPARKTAKKDSVQLSQRQKDVQEFRKLLSTEEKKMFDLLFPAENSAKAGVKPGTEKRTAAIGNRYKAIERPARQKSLGSRFDIRG